MLFPSNFSCKLLANGRRFSLLNILDIPANFTGIYVLLYKHNFVYVGQSKDIRKRLNMHYNESQNDRLSIWVKALYGDMRFIYLPCKEMELNDFERSLIHYLQPVTNRNRYSDYTPKATKLEKSTWLPYIRQ